MQAVALYVPDYEGASQGINDFHIFLDAAGYGVGAGLFQAPSAAARSLRDSPYAILETTAWATQADLARAYRSAGRPLDMVESAWETLGTVQNRRRYDEQKGLTDRRAGRAELRPLGFWSRSLSSCLRLRPW